MKKADQALIRKPAFGICENKDADKLHSNREADQRLCFCYTDSTTPLLPKSEISSLQPSSVAVQPGLCRTWSETPKTGFLAAHMYRDDLVFSGLIAAVDAVIKCAIDTFTAKKCVPDLVNSLKETLYPENPTNPVQQVFLTAFSGCDIDPTNFPAVTLPEGYGVVEPRDCEAEVKCDTAAIKPCMETLSFDNDCG